MPTSKRKALPRGVDRVPSGYRARLFADGKQHTLGVFQTIGDARAALDIARGEKARGLFVPPSQRKAEHKAKAAQEAARKAREQFLVRDLFTEWHDWHRRQGWKRSTSDAHQTRWQTYIAPALGTRPVTEITRAEVDKWFDSIRKNHGPGAARIAYTTLAAMMKYATGQAAGQYSDFTPYITASPCQTTGATKHVPVRHPAREVATLDEVDALAALMPPGSELAVLLAGYCGLRRGEVMALRRRHLSTTGPKASPQWWISVETQLQRTRDGRLVETSPKSEAGRRIVPVPPTILPHLQQHLDDDAGPGPDGLLFPQRRRGPDYGRPETLASRFTTARNKFNARCADEGQPTLDGFTFHMLRHTALTRMGEVGATLEELRAIAGHASYRQVQRYQHATRDRLADLANRMGQ